MKGNPEIIDMLNARWGNLADEEEYLNWFESQLGEIWQMTLPFYLQMITADKK